MGLFIPKNIQEKKIRKIYIDLLFSNKINQPENFIGNAIKTRHYTL